MLKRIFSEFVSGALFGAGLMLSGMTDPAKVIGFLDAFGVWDPSLALVMGGAIAIALPAFAMAKKRHTSFLGDTMRLPTAKQIDRRLIAGALIFGGGWGLAGFCPGPALVSLVTGQPKALMFVAFMMLGMGLFEFVERRKHI
jgi:uncharacterized membrane protein YedE/YeeE